MKKNIILSAAASALLFAGAAHAGNTIQFLGEITDSTCDVALEGDGQSSTVTLPTVSKTALPALDSTAGRTMFALLASNCTLANGKTKVAAFFYANDAKANSVDTASGYLNNIATDTPAQNVKLRLIDGTGGGIIKVGYDQSSTVGVDVDGSGNARMPYAVEYIATDAAGATAGAVEASVVYDLMYP
ncbi:fimbrial protein [Enterobacter roggenkampii]|uniref:fimbrial protein n=1 Tax=Enterobacter roggenkampii TaxID=1812935 RepID=UPI002DB8F143|nr:fimbrial protein [Enterobacter roggenkampii]MEB6186385.1 fimbrial protein [Enterobacter roggenkampii]